MRRSQFDFEPSVGGVVRAEGEGVAPHPFTIVEVTVVSIRPATEEELAEAAAPEN